MRESAPLSRRSLRRRMRPTRRGSRCKTTASRKPWAGAVFERALRLLDEQEAPQDMHGGGGEARGAPRHGAMSSGGNSDVAFCHRKR